MKNRYCDTCKYEAGYMGCKWGEKTNPFTGRIDRNGDREKNELGDCKQYKPKWYLWWLK